MFLHPGILPPGDLAEFNLVDEISQSDPVKKKLDLVTKLVPQIMRQAAMASIAIVHTTAPGSIHTFVHGSDHIGNGDFRGRLIQ